MNIRTRKLLSILLAVSMVFSLNIAAFGAEPVVGDDDDDTVITTEPQPGPGTIDEAEFDKGFEAGSNDGYNAGYSAGRYGGSYNPSPYTYGMNVSFKAGYEEGYYEYYDEGYYDGLEARSAGVEVPTSRTQIADFAYDVFAKDANGNVATKVDLTGDATKISGLSVNKLTDLRETSKGKAIIQTILTAGKPGEDTYLVNKKDIKVSGNMADNYGIDGMVSPRSDAYYDVVELEGGDFLFLEYHSADYSLGWVSGVQDPIPVIRYTGQKIEFNKPKAKDNKGKNFDLCVDAALVKFANGTIEKVPGVSVTGAKVDKNGKDASVSGERVPVKASRKSLGYEFKDAEFEEFVKAGNAADIPTFTIKVKAADAAKSSKKAINKALKDKKYQFAIRQWVMYVGAPDGASYTTTNKTVSFNDSETGSDYVGNVESDVLDFSGKLGSYWYDSDETICVSKFNGKKANVTTSFVASGKGVVVKLKPGKDYELKTDGSLGASGTAIAYIDSFKGNYMYSNLNGLSQYGLKYAFRQSPNNKKLLRGGVYKAAGDGFVYSAE